jgi:hypothetical protein
MVSKAYIVELLKTRDAAVAKALVALNERQTYTEQNAQSTINHNGVGFTPADARMGTSMATFFLKRGYLTPKQIAYWRKPNAKGVPRICKYAGQLVEVANEKAKSATAKTIKQAAPTVDVGNLMEEKMVLDERIGNLRYEIGMYMDSDDEAGIAEMNAELKAMEGRKALINREMVEA